MAVSVLHPTARFGYQPSPSAAFSINKSRNPPAPGLDPYRKLRTLPCGRLAPWARVPNLSSKVVPARVQTMNQVFAEYDEAEDRDFRRPAPALFTVSNFLPTPIPCLPRSYPTRTNNSTTPPFPRTSHSSSISRSRPLLCKTNPCHIPCTGCLTSWYSCPA